MTFFAPFILLLSISFSALAGQDLILTDFKNQDALQAVLANPQVMQSLESYNSYPHRTSVSVVSTGLAYDKIFVIRLTNSTPTGSGLKSCYNDIKVVTQLKTEKNKLGKASIRNHLVVEQVAPEICRKRQSLTASI